MIKVEIQREKNPRWWESCGLPFLVQLPQSDQVISVIRIIHATGVFYGFDLSTGITVYNLRCENYTPFKGSITLSNTYYPGV